MNLKPGPNYKMSKTNKMRLTRYLDPHLRGQIKRGIIEADLFAIESAKHVDKKKNNNKDEE